MGWLSHRDNPLRTPFQKDHLLLPIDWNKEYITLGSTEDEVIAVQGKPDYISRARYRALGECHSYIYGDYYGENGNIEFENGRVTGWDIRTSPLKVKLVPEENTVEKDYFTLGSTLDEVAAIQGTPDYFTFPYFLLYGSSKVSLKDGRVISWNFVKGEVGFQSEKQLTAISHLNLHWTKLLQYKQLQITVQFHTTWVMVRLTYP